MASAILENPPTPPNAYHPPGGVATFAAMARGTILLHLAPRKLVQSASQKAKAKAEEWSDNDEESTLFGAPLRRRGTAATIPKEQTEGWERTRQRVSEALSKLLPPTLLVTHELLEIGSEVLKFAPIPGLNVAARLLLSIWDDVQAVDVEQEMQEPLQKLVQTFTQVRDFLVKQAHRLFLKRYFKRDETVREIAGCDSSLTDALSMFSLSVQMRILRQVKETKETAVENRALLEAIAARQNNALGIAVDQGQLTPRPGVIALPDEHTHADVLPPSTLSKPSNPPRTLSTLRTTRPIYAPLYIFLLLSLYITVSDDTGIGRTYGDAGGTRDAAARARARRRVTTPPPFNAPGFAAAGQPFPPAPPRYTVRGGVTRSGTLESSESSESSRAASAGLAMPRDTLDREFIEGGIDALRRMSKGGEMLPSGRTCDTRSTATSRSKIGFFSDVYKGTWRGRTVAIKCLAPTTPRELFIKEVNIWRELKHPNVLELYGASGDGLWFFVCPYERFGSLSTFLRRVGHEGDAAKNRKEGDLLRFMHEVAKGMEYLHDKGVLHGDLKQLVGGEHPRRRPYPLPSLGFWQSEMKSEAYRIHGAGPPHGGTLRWQASELMLGSNELTPEMDVCSGQHPAQDPVDRFNTPGVQELLRVCWDKDPAVRPPFSKIDKETKQLRRAAELPFDGFDSPRGPDWREVENAGTSRPSPDMHPIPLPKTPRKSRFSIPELFHSLTLVYISHGRASVSPDPSPNESFHTVAQTVSSSGSDVPEPVVYTASSRASSIFTPSTKSSSVDDLTDFLLADYGGYESPMPADEGIAEIRNERCAGTRFPSLAYVTVLDAITWPLTFKQTDGPVS
ncbi:hypothetical protein B0H13DRAFT_1884934 [Mycena leptocephala]|nr:hypothetical protein B0H13DRAFT_1884934 [Mycena leptocephala]